MNLFVSLSRCVLQQTNTDPSTNIGKNRAKAKLYFSKEMVVNWLIGLVVFVGNESFIKDEEDDQNDGHHYGHETESVPRSISRV